MAKLYIFGIGGTGSRVLRSFTMLMAAGVKLDVDEIVPIIIDPDHANADLTRTVTLMNSYRAIREHLTFNSANACQFFRHEFLKELSNYTLQINDTDDKKFKQFIDLSSMDKANKAMTKMLFSDKNLDSSMDVGFKGNPNIGSVVLDQIVSSDGFTDFANSFAAGDKIFIISSIFGGTGASGFPLLLKTLRTGKTFPNNDIINRAEIGAITILPYFKLQADEESEIDSSTFISKTKSALAYYENNISNNNSIDSIYYLADEISNTYENHEGGTAQKNDAHLIEFLAATAIVDFANKPNTTGSTLNKELGLQDLEGAVTFLSFYDEEKRLLCSPLTQFLMMSNSLIDEFSYFSSSGFNANNNHFEGLYTTAFMSKLRDFCYGYKEWLEEMKLNKRSLDLFNLECRKKPFDLLTGIRPEKVFSIKSDYSLVADRLNSSIGKCKSKTKEDKFLEMFYLGTERLFKEKFIHA